MVKLPPFQRPQHVKFISSNSDEERGMCHLTLTPSKTLVISPDRYSNFTFLKRITTWILCFINNCQLKDARKFVHLAVEEMILAKKYWISLSQEDSFAQEITALKFQCSIFQTSRFLPLNSFLDSSEILRVGGKEQHSNLHHSQQHPVILHGKYFVSKIMVHTEHQSLLHAGPTLLISSLCRRFHIIGCWKLVCSIT